jgi:Ser/Thr protein kinase RdoA (MazF antagonist)
MIVIELLGSPGSGKTTLVPPIIEGLRAQGWEAYRMVDAARRFAARSHLGRISTPFVPPPLRDPWLWRVFAILSTFHALAFFIGHPNLARQALWLQRFRPAAADVRQRRVVSWFFRTAGRYAFLSAHARSGEVLVLDEGFVHRVVQLFASPAEVPRSSRLAAYLSEIPRPDLVVHVCAPAPVCEERIRVRGVWARIQDEDAPELEAFVRNAHRTVEMTAGQIRRERWAVVDIDNGGPEPGAAVEEVRRAVSTALGSRPDPSLALGATPVRRRGPLVPKPGRILDVARSRVHPAAIDAVTVSRVLERYGLEPTRSPQNPATGWRNRIVVVNTSGGRKVLKQFRSDRKLPSVIWEHSIIDHLERLEFPSVRLTTTSSDTNLVEEDGGRFALFDFVEGRNLAGFVMPQLLRSALVRTASETLATFHRTVDGFDPEGEHALGYHTYASARTRDVDWHLSTLDELVCATDSLTSPEERSRSEWLCSRAPLIAARVSELGEMLEGADLPRRVIHGDFGMHNLLFRSDGTAVVHDFELARIEWRLIDLIIVLSRLGEDRGRDFLTAYRATSELTRDEERHLGDVWQYYRLRGAVQSWNSFFELGGVRRLETAQRRVEEADARAGRPVRL